MNISCAPGSNLSLNYSQLFLLDLFRVLRMPDWTSSTELCLCLPSKPSTVAGCYTKDCGPPPQFLVEFHTDSGLTLAGWDHTS